MLVIDRTVGNMSVSKAAIGKQTESRNRGFSLHQRKEVDKQLVMHSANVFLPLKFFSRRLQG